MSQSIAACLLVALTLWILGYLHTGRFVRPRWKIPGKLLFYLGISWLLAVWVGAFSLIFIVGHPLLGFLFHVRACRRHGIDWLTCRPREKYLALWEKWEQGKV